MPQGTGYHDIADEADQRQLNKYNEEILKLRAELSKVTSAANGNFERIGSVLGKTADEARDLGRQATATTIRTKRQQLEQQLQAVQRQKLGYEKSIITSRAGKAAIAATKLPAPDKDALVAAQQNPQAFMDKYLTLEQQFQEASQDPNVPYETKVKLGVELRQQAAIHDLSKNIITDINEQPPKGDAGYGSLITRAMSIVPQTLSQVRPVTSDQIAQSAYQPGAIPGVGGGVTGLTATDSMNPAAVEAAQGIQSSLRQQAPDPGPSLRGQNADQLQAFAGRGEGQGLQAPPGQQLTFTGTGGQVSAGYAPVGSENPFAQMTQDPRMTQQVMQNTLKPLAQYAPASAMPSADGQTAPLPPPPPGISASHQRYLDTGSPVITTPPASYGQTATFLGQQAGAGPLAQPPMQGPPRPTPEDFRQAELAARRAQGQMQPPVAQPGAAQPPAVPVDAVGARVQQLIQAGTPPATIAAELISRNIDPALYGLR